MTQQVNPFLMNMNQKQKTITVISMISALYSVVIYINILLCSLIIHFRYLYQNIGDNVTETGIENETIDTQEKIATEHGDSNEYEIATEDVHGNIYDICFICCSNIHKHFLVFFNNTFWIFISKYRR
jgi:hypothetical protein